MSYLRLSLLVKPATGTNTRTLKVKFVIAMLVFSLSNSVSKKKNLIPNRVNIKIPNTSPAVSTLKNTVLTVT